MFDVALSNAGACISLASCSDERFPPENMIDGSSDTFWVTTGLYPHEFVISFSSLMTINSVKIEAHNLKVVRLERCVQNEPNDFEPIGEKEFEFADSTLQTEEFTLDGTTALHMRVVIESGHNHFSSVHRVHVDGNAVHT